MQELPKQMKYPALPGVILEVVKNHCTTQDFLTISAIRDKILESVSVNGYKPTKRERELFTNRIQHAVRNGTVSDIDPKVIIAKRPNTRKQLTYKIYYNV
jgi:hypothetical protein